MDRARHRASRGSRLLSLTRKEFGILEMLVAADDALVSAEELIEHVWDANIDPFSNIVSVTMSRLRRKLGDPRSSRRSRTWATRSPARPAGPGGLPEVLTPRRPDDQAPSSRPQ